MLPHKVCKLPVLRVEFNDAYPVLDFLQKNRISLDKGYHSKNRETAHRTDMDIIGRKKANNYAQFMHDIRIPLCKSPFHCLHMKLYLKRSFACIESIVYIKTLLRILSWLSSIFSFSMFGHNLEQTEDNYLVERSILSSILISWQMDPCYLRPCLIGSRTHSWVSHWKAAQSQRQLSNH